MLIVNTFNGSIYYEGIDEADCQANMPKGNYIIMPYERYDDYISLLQDQMENQVTN